MKCPLCNSQQVESLFIYQTHSLVKCKNCQLIFQSQSDRLNASDLINQIYDENWIRMKEQAAIKDLYEHYSFYNLFIEMYSPDKGELLEIGCGTGEFLYLAQNTGWNVTGIEPSTKASSYAVEHYKLNIINSVWNEKLSNSAQKFDAIVFWHVLEHIPDPVIFLNQLRLKLKPNGIIFFSIPNNESLINTLLMGDSPNYSEKDHLFHYSRNNLLELLNYASLEPLSLLSRETPWRFEQEVQLFNQISTDEKIDTLDKLIKTYGKLQSNSIGYELICASREKIKAEILP